MTKYLLIALLLFTSNCKNDPTTEAPGEPGHPLPNLTKEQFDLIYELAAVLPERAELSLALIQDGKTDFYGIKREKKTTLTIDNHNRVFEIGSITKVFTGTLLANSVLQQKVDLDHSIDQFLDFSLKSQEEITFKQLATHTSGLPRIPPSLDSVSLENPYRNFGEVELKAYLSEGLELEQKPGRESTYSNLGVGLLGYVLTKVEQASYEKLLQNYIFSKYRMNHSTTVRSNIVDKLVKGLNDQGEEVSNWDMAVLVGAGGILSTVQDLAKFAVAQFEPANRELTLSRTNFFEVNENFSMGLGWSIIQTENGAHWNWHNGGTGGYSSSMILNTEAKNGVILLSNVSALGKLTTRITGLAPALMNTLEKD